MTRNNYKFVANYNKQMIKWSNGQKGRVSFGSRIVVPPLGIIC